MAAKGRADDHAGGERFEQRRIIAAGERREVARGVDQLVAEARGTLARLPGPEPLAAGLGGTRREPLGSLDMRYHEAGERHRTRLEQVGQSAEASVQPIDKAAQPGVFIA